MPNIGTALREEIARLSRRQTRSQVDPTKKVTAQHRREIAELKRHFTQLLMALRGMGKREARARWSNLARRRPSVSPSLPTS